MLKVASIPLCLSLGLCIVIFHLAPLSLVAQTVAPGSDRTIRDKCLSKKVDAKDGEAAAKTISRRRYFTDYIIDCIQRNRGKYRMVDTADLCKESAEKGVQEGWLCYPEQKKNCGSLSYVNLDGQNIFVCSNRCDEKACEQKMERLKSRDKSIVEGRDALEALKKRFSGPESEPPPSNKGLKNPQNYSPYFDRGSLDETPDAKKEAAIPNSDRISRQLYNLAYQDPGRTLNYSGQQFPGLSSSLFDRAALSGQYRNSTDNAGSGWVAENKTWGQETFASPSQIDFTRIRFVRLVL